MEHKKMIPIIPIILAGGSGKRLWPLSVDSFPKQFQHLIDDKFTLLQATMNRASHIPETMQPLIVANAKHRFIIAEQIQQFEQPATILLENESRNTAAAITLAVLYALRETPDPYFLIMPSDHYIKDPLSFSKQVQLALATALSGKLVTFGVTPTSAETCYGYIKKGKKLNGAPGYEVDYFVEKPDIDSAKKFMNEGHYEWNSGIFLFQSSIFLQEIKEYAPTVLQACQEALKTVIYDGDFIHIDNQMQDCPNISIDKAIFEKTKQTAVFPLDLEWKDVGSWNALYDIAKKDVEGNATNGPVATMNTKNCYLYTTKPLIVTSGIENIIVVVTEDAVLVARRDEALNLEEKLESDPF